MKHNHQARAHRAHPVLGKLAGLLALVFSAPVEAILINDRAAAAAGGVANYWDRDNRESSVGALFLIASRGADCSGTLINARTFLTASHCVLHGGSVIDLSDTQVRFGPDASQRGEHDRDIIGARGHEHYPGTATDHMGAVANTNGGDVALVTLSAPVTAIRPVVLLRAGEQGPIRGALLTLAGYGQAANGSQTDSASDARRRVAQSVLGFYERLRPTDLEPIYGASFRNPDSPGDPDPHGLNANGIPVPALQGSAAPGDSGGPVFWTRPDGVRVQIGTVIGPNVGPNLVTELEYGITTLWTSVSRYTAWIDTHNPLRQVMAAQGQQRWSNAVVWTDGMGRHETPDNKTGNMTSGLGDTGRFYQVGLVAPGRMTVDIDPTIDTLAVLGSQATLALPAGRRLKVVDQAALALGTIELNGRLEAKRFDMNGGLLAGSGQLATSHGVTVVGGMVAPGGAGIGTLSVTGNYTQGGDMVLAVGARDAVSDRLAVSGNVTLNGGTLAVVAGKGVYRTDFDYEVLTAAAVQGQFGAVRSDLAFLSPTLATAPTAVRLKLARNGASFASVADPNHAGIAASVERMGQGSALVGALTSTNAAQARHAFGQLSGESLASNTSGVIDHTRYLREAAVMRMRGEAARGAAASGVNTGDVVNDGADRAWAQGFGSWGRMAAGNGTASMDSNMQGLMVGLAHAFSPATRAGVAASFARGTLSVGERAASSRIDSYEVLLHAAHRQGPWRLRGGGGVGMSELVSQRMPSLPGFSDQTRARYRLPLMQAFGELGYAMPVGRAEVEPFFNLAHVRTRATGFTESGGAAALRGRIDAQQATLVTTGVRAGWQLDDSSGARWHLGSTLGWRHALRNRAPTVSTGLIAGGGRSTVQGAALAANRLAVQLDLARNVGGYSQLGFSYGGEWAAKAQDHMLRATWQQKF